MVLTTLEGHSGRHDPDTRHAVQQVSAVLNSLDEMPAATLDEAERSIRAWLPGWFIYRGGSHVAIHTRSGEPRIGLVTEATAQHAREAAYAALVTWLHREEGLEPRSAAKAVGASYGLEERFIGWALDRIEREGGAA